MSADKMSIERFVLANGLRVIAAPNHSSPIVGVAVVYDVGFRSEPEARTGFAHLFEHLMFQGSANVAKIEHMRLVEGAGGVFNGHTMADLTAYYQAVPAGALELALWLEADRMRTLAVTEENLANQIAVVEEEIKGNVINQPYGGFPWIVLPELAFDSYANAHNGYGDFAHLESSTVAMAIDFYADYYAPSNAVLTVAGDCEPAAVLELAERHFADIPRRPTPPHGPWPEPPLQKQRSRVIEDPLAPQPAFAAGYRTPDPVTNIDQHLAYAVTASVLADGEASRLVSRLVHRDQTVTDISCQLGIFGIDNLFMRDPVLFQIVVHHPGTATTGELLDVVDEELNKLAEEGPSTDELERVAASTVSAYWKGVDSVMDRAITLSSLEVIHGRAELIAELPERVVAVSNRDVARAAADLVSQRRAIVEIRPTTKPGSSR
ncbi:MAG: M16 family metallopeptidase [Acidimicrobiales bacterium]